MIARQLKEWTNGVLPLLLIKLMNMKQQLELILCSNSLLMMEPISILSERNSSKILMCTLEYIQEITLDEVISTASHLLRLTLTIWMIPNIISQNQNTEL
jgi:hypothetical protein